MTEAPSPSSLLVSLHYAFPPAVFAFYAITSAIATCTLQTIRDKGQHPRRRLVTLLMLFACLTYFAQFLLILVLSLTSWKWLGRQDTVIYLLSCTLIYGMQLAILADARAPAWHPYIGSYLLALFLEPFVGTLSFLHRGPGPLGALQFTDISIEASRYVSLILIPVAYFGLQDKLGRGAGSDSERQSLLQKSAVSDSEETLINGYGSTPDSSTDGDQTPTENAESPYERRQRLTQEKMRKRLQDTGNWFTYAKSFMVFFPYVWPVKNRALQARVVLVALCLLANNLLNVLIPRQLGIVTDTLGRAHQGHSGDGWKNPWVQVLIFAALKLTASEAGISLLRQWLWIPVEFYSNRALTTAAYSHVLNLSSDFHDSKSSSDLMVAIASGQNVSNMLEAICFSAIPNLIDLTAAFIYLSVTLGAYEGLITFATAIIFLFISARIIANLRSARRSEISAFFEEHYVQQSGIQGWTTVASFNQIAHEEQRHRNAVENRVAKTQAVYLGYLFAYAYQYLVLLAGLLAGSFLAVYQVTAGEATAGEFVMLLTYWSQLVAPLNFFASLGKRISKDLIGAEELLELMQTKPTVVDKPTARPFVLAGGSVDFKNVCFSYDKKKAILKGISLSVPSGTTVAFVGATGAGKSTILKLLDRFYDVTEGAIEIDGQDIRDVNLSSLRAQIGVVPQTPILFDNTIMNNIRYAKLSATDEEVFEACRAAAIHDQILGFTDGYNTRVGERGIKLSGGELQRVAIARAILKRPSMVLLDEATSAVDTETESQIQDALRTLCKGRTTFIVAHRLSTIVNADTIVVVSNGEIAESGSHDDLITANGKYAELWAKQIFVKPREQPPAENSTVADDIKSTKIVNDLAPESMTSEATSGSAVAKPSTDSGMNDAGDGEVSGQPAGVKTPSAHRREGSKLNPGAPEFTPRSLLRAVASPTSEGKSVPHDPFQPAPIIATTVSPVRISEPLVVLLPPTNSAPPPSHRSQGSSTKHTSSATTEDNDCRGSEIAPKLQSKLYNKNNRNASYKYPRYSRRIQSKSEPSTGNTEDS